ncbi:hypothetical protein [Halobacteriovorax sp. JY17]|uniref:hypothetical protein n=1 Tax=Halobacteriovorax sp. JY17 TaxID=2014617 RepID=UPI000C3B8D16|nr:hypothetical protein [Halobacteriovorax sp. JY17]PIK16222.1 MAG: hypothetical protein CES88_05665 [Halobacteriovorax sp. JY17]
MQKYLLFLLILVFQSCNSLEGGLHNFTTYSLLDGGEEIELTTGLVPVNLVLKSKRLFTIEYLDHSFDFKIPKDQALPDYAGEIRLTSSQVGQEYGVYAKISTTIFQGELIREQEDCSWVERYTTCDEDRNCRIEYRSRNGVKEVSFSNNIHQKLITLNLNVDETGEIISQFLGQKTLIKKVYRYESTCY